MMTSEDVKRARQQATAALSQARQPLYAMLGAGELASEAVRDYVAKARAQAGGQATQAQSRVADVQTRLVELQDRLAEVRTQVRAKVGELPEGVAGLRGRLESGELRHSLEGYFQSLQELYERLATRGEATVEKLRHGPQPTKATVQDGVTDSAEAGKQTGDEATSTP
jgi:heparin binding hemagglutinin HbhA